MWSELFKISFSICVIRTVRTSLITEESDRTILLNHSVESSNWIITSNHIELSYRTIPTELLHFSEAPHDSNAMFDLIRSLIKVSLVICLVQFLIFCEMVSCKKKGRSLEKSIFGLSSNDRRINHRTNRRTNHRPHKAWFRLNCNSKTSRFGELKFKTARSYRFKVKVSLFTKQCLAVPSWHIQAEMLPIWSLWKELKFSYQTKQRNLRTKLWSL